MRDFTEIWQLQDTIITAVNACGYGVWDLHATSWGFTQYASMARLR